MYVYNILVKGKCKKYKVLVGFFDFLVVCFFYFRGIKLWMGLNILLFFV